MTLCCGGDGGSEGNEGGGVSDSTMIGVGGRSLSIIGIMTRCTCVKG